MKRLKFFILGVIFFYTGSINGQEIILTLEECVLLAIEKNISIKLNKILEDMVALNPGQWILTHNRWK